MTSEQVVKAQNLTAKVRENIQPSKVAGFHRQSVGSCFSEVKGEDEYTEEVWLWGDRERLVNLEPEQVRHAAAQGDAPAQTSLGMMYFHGEGVEEDKVEAAKWHRLAAEQGLAEAQYSLGLMYSHGLGVPPDGREAVKWLRMAAEQGHAFGQFYLALMYSVGDRSAHGDQLEGNVPRDFVEAMKWMQLAAEQGRAWGQYSLGIVHYEGGDFRGARYPLRRRPTGWAREPLRTGG